MKSGCFQGWMTRWVIYLIDNLGMMGLWSLNRERWVA